MVSPDRHSKRTSNIVVAGHICGRFLNAGTYDTNDVTINMTGSTDTNRVTYKSKETRYNTTEYIVIQTSS